MGNVHAFQIVFLILLCSVVVFAGVAKRLSIPYPIVLMLAGLLLAFVPGIPLVPLNPDLIFLVVLPPLLYAAAWQTSWREFSFNISSILLLAFGLVGFTVLGVALLGPKFLPGFDWRTAFVLGAVVSTTDAIAATAIGQRLGLPGRVMAVLEGESLVNDASGLLALEFGLAMVVRGEDPTLSFALWRLVVLVVGGIGIGLLTGVAVNKLERFIDDGPVEIGVTVLVPYAVYLGAEAVHASGVLAVVAAGLYLSRKSTALFSPQVRLQVASVWGALVFLMNGFVFVLMGLQLPYIQQEIKTLSPWQAVEAGAVFSLTLIALRLLWIFPSAYLAAVIRRHLQHQNFEYPPVKQVFVVGWTGMRGVVALAAAVSLPRELENGQPFTQRSLIVFLTFSVIFVTLVLQGLTLPPLIRALRFSDDAEPDCEEEEARSLIIKAALKRLEEIRKADAEEYAPVYDDIANHYRGRLYNVTGKEEDLDGMGGEHVRRFRDTSRKIREVERQTAIKLRDDRRINDELLRRIEHELDLVDSRTGLEGDIQARQRDT